MKSSFCTRSCLAALIKVTAFTSPNSPDYRDVINRANEILVDLEKHAPTATVEPSRLNQVAQAALFPKVADLDELDKLDVMAMTPLEAINKLYEWKRRYGNSQ